MEQTDRIELLNRCADLTRRALELADQAHSPLSGALLEEALTAIVREAGERTRRID